MASGLMGLRPWSPVPWRREIFSSSVISLRTRSARSSAEREGFIHDWVWGWGCTLGSSAEAGRTAVNIAANMTAREKIATIILDLRDVMVMGV
jgi:hypothetical protein